MLVVYLWFHHNKLAVRDDSRLVAVFDKFANQVSEEFSHKTYSLRRSTVYGGKGLYFVSQIRFDVWDARLVLDIKNFASEKLGEDYSVNVSVRTGNTGFEVIHARWVDVAFKSFSLDKDPESRLPLNNFPSVCSKCNWKDWNAIPDPYFVNESFLESKNEKLDIIEGSSIFFVRDAVWEVLNDLVPDDFQSGKIQVKGKQKPLSGWHWIYPVHATPGRFDVGESDEKCSECGNPDRYCFDMGNITAMTLFKDFGGPKWNLARTFYPGTWVPEDKERAQRPYASIMMSGGLFRALWNHGFKGLEWPDQIYASLNPNQPMIEESIRFQDYKPKLKDKAIKQSGESGLWFGYEKSVNEAPIENQKKALALLPELRPQSVDDLTSVISDHIEKHVGKIGKVLHELIPISNTHVDINIVYPTNEKPYYTLVTGGMSSKPMKMPKLKVTPPDISKYAELVVCLPPDWKIDEMTDERWNFPVVWMRYLANYVHEEKKWLSIAHTIPNTDQALPFTDNTELNCWLIRYLQTMPIDAQSITYKKKTIRLLGMTAITNKEMEYALSNEASNLDELNAVLYDRNVGELVDLTRESVV